MNDQLLSLWTLLISRKDLIHYIMYLWDIMKFYGVQEKITKIIQLLYQDAVFLSEVKRRTGFK